MKALARAICLVAVSGTSLLAQSYDGSFTKGSPANLPGMVKNSVGVGPYKGMLSAAAAPASVQYDINFANTSNSGYNFWCVDGKGVFQTDNTITVQTIASLAAGSLKTKLAQAAYVTTLYQSFGGPVTAANVSNFNAAIWKIMGHTPDNFSAGSNTTRDNYIASAQANYGNLDLSNFYYVQFDANGYNKGGAQELIFQGGPDPFVVPEPASFALISVGLFGIAAVRRRRATA